MLVMVAFVLWASLLHVTMEEEKDLFDEFPGGCFFVNCFNPDLDPGLCR